MLTVHHLENSRSHRIVWLLEELGIDYEIKRYGRDKESGLAPSELLEVHPLGKAPVIVDGDKTIAESGAIIEYLIYEYDDGHLKPADGTPEQLAYTYWLHYAEGTFASFMMLSLVMGRIEDAPLPFFLKPVDGTPAGCFVVADVGHFIAPGDSQLLIIVPAGQFSALQGIVFYVADACLDDSFRFRIAPLASDRFQIVVSTQGQKFGMETSVAARAVDNGRFQVVKNDLSWAATIEFQGVTDGPIEFGFALG